MECGGTNSCCGRRPPSSPRPLKPLLIQDFEFARIQHFLPSCLEFGEWETEQLGVAAGVEYKIEAVVGDALPSRSGKGQGFPVQENSKAHFKPIAPVLFDHGRAVWSEPPDVGYAGPVDGPALKPPAATEDGMFFQTEV
jgi:hypothetical protein